MALTGFNPCNISTTRPVMDFISAIEDALGKKALKNMLPMQAGDVEATYANIDDLRDAVGFSPSTPLKVGINKFVEWHMAYYS